MRDALIALIEALTAQILAGEIRMPTQIYNQLRDGIEFGFGELFDQCLQEQMGLADRQFAAEPKDSIGQAKLQRRQRALKSIKTEWDRYEADNQGQAAIDQAVRGLLDCESDELLETLLGLIDPNRAQPLTPSQILAIARGLGWRPEGRSVQVASAPPAPQAFGFGGGAATTRTNAGGSGFGFGLAAEPPAKPVPAEPIAPAPIEPDPPALEEPDLAPIVPNTVPTSIVPSSLQVARGLARAMLAWQDLESNLLAWLYEGSQPGFGPSASGPWQTWARQVDLPLPRRVFLALAGEGVTAQTLAEADLQQWTELAVLVQRMQQGLVSWFDKQPFDAKVGRRMSITTYMTFSSFWGQLWKAFGDRQPYADGCFQLVLQLLRHFAQRADFPLYGGIYASLSGSYLQSTLDYLDKPLRRVDNTQEKARILTLLATSQRVMGKADRAMALHQEAAEIAGEAGDRRCQVANLNHISRIFAQQKNFSDAISYAQRAVIIARQLGDKQGQANALANLGYAEVCAAQRPDQVEPEQYETSIGYLEQAKRLAEQQGDSASRAIACSSLGRSQLLVGQIEAAIGSLEQGVQGAHGLGDVFLLGQSALYLSEARRSAGRIDGAIGAAALALYLLWQIRAAEWTQAATLLQTLRSQLELQGELEGEFAFMEALQRAKPQLIAVIGIEGFEAIPGLIREGWERSE
jgi:tetratricopeptide (TPR) repeat protein